ncbi:AraC family transcriptional regulator [Hahella aquimaris]|uniref:AraC-type DNA-binding domain-containing protein n=1 Tax=Hahella chejuensis (strain KCTC 2396) TaxID=349521 RepID=Q2SMF8_HAHCH|nr:MULTISPECIES: AraC family transcriptional regulator [Hahella]ABC28166.1 AraC-type DNA-binding domain-containing protein [Hahella chejuensis KCTC 2396]WLQ12000.1 AraC family transcriptional regulator [Hahella sp. HNIBRBA332]
MRKMNKGVPEIELTDRSAGTVRYIEHGFPSDLIRWHVHEEYELHFIVATTGKVFIGDYVGLFGPGQLILTGPRLPHNWISKNDPESEVELRDMLLHFNHDTIEQGIKVIPELSQLLPMLERARSGIEFIGVDLDEVRSRFAEIRDATGLARIVLFFDFMNELAAWPNYRMLSTMQINSKANETMQRKINTVVEYVINNIESPISLQEVAELVGMTDSHFSRFFRKATGNRFVEFLNRIRVSRACCLLAETDEQVASICFQVGFNNVANFNRRFQELKGLTPREYRQQATQRF